MYAVWCQWYVLVWKLRCKFIQEVLGLSLPLVLMRVWTFSWGSEETMQGHHGYVPTLAHTRSPISYSTHTEGTALSTCTQQPSAIFNGLSAVLLHIKVTGKESRDNHWTTKWIFGLQIIFSKAVTLTWKFMALIQVWGVYQECTKTLRVQICSSRATFINRGVCWKGRITL